MNKREKWLDIAKGLGILSVVVGHSLNPIAHYLHWFHMPLFFLITGYLFKPLQSKSELTPYLLKKAHQLLIPYLIFGVAITSILFLIEPSLIQFLKNIFKLIYGGQLLTGYYGVFWFVTCLYLTQSLFSIILLKMKKVSSQFITLSCLFLSAHLIATIPSLANIRFPWNADVVLISIFYFAVGYYSKNYLKQLVTRKATLFISFFLCLLLILMEGNSLFTYELDLKNNIYKNLLLDSTVPILFSIFVFSISHYLSLYRSFHLIEYMGLASMTIMYWHVPINRLVQLAFSEYNDLIYVVIGVGIPLLIHRPITYFFKRISLQHLKISNRAPHS